MEDQKADQQSDNQQSAPIQQQVKFTYRIFKVSSQDDEYPANELMIQGKLEGFMFQNNAMSFDVSLLVILDINNCKGWQTKRFCQYPQEIILQFPSEITLKNVQILCHQHKTPREIDIISMTANLKSNSQEENSEHTIIENGIKSTNLGTFTLKNNSEQGANASRELKSIQISAKCQYLKIVCHKCIENKYNLFNQVGFMNITCFGEITGNEKDYIKALQTINPAEANFLDSMLSSSLGKSGSGIGITSPLQPQQTLSPISNNLRGQTIQASSTSKNYAIPPVLARRPLALAQPDVEDRLKSLQVRKQKAVDIENYSEAKALKRIYDQLHELNANIREIENQKKTAIQREDFDTAQMLKFEQEKLRGQLNAIAIQDDQFNTRGGMQKSKGIDFKKKQLIPARQSLNQQIKKSVTIIRDIDDSGRQQNSMRSSRAARPDGSVTPNDHKGRRPSLNQPRQTTQREGRSLAPSPYDFIGEQQSLGGRATSQERNKNLRLPADQRKSVSFANTGIENPYADQSHPVTPFLAKNRDDAVIPALKLDQPINFSEVNDSKANPPTVSGVVHLQNDEVNQKEEEVDQVKIQDDDTLDPNLRQLFDFQFLIKVNSSNWHDREEGLEGIKSQLEQAYSKSQDRNETFKSLIQIILLTMQDKLTQVQLKSFGLLKETLAFFKDIQITQRDQYESILFTLLLKTIDSNQRLKELSESTFRLIIEQKSVEPESILTILITYDSGTRKFQNSFKMILVRLNLISTTLDIFESLDSQRKQKYLLDKLIEYILAYFSNSNSEIRTISFNIFIKIHRIFGLKKTEPYFKNIQTQHLEAISKEVPELLDFFKSLQPKTTLNQALGQAVGSGSKPETSKKKKSRAMLSRSLNANEGAEIDQDELNHNNTLGLNDSLDKSLNSVAKRPLEDFYTSLEKVSKCPFCEYEDQLFQEEGKLNKHYDDECIMLHPCPGCKEIVQINNLETHIMKDCVGKNKFSKCKKCQEPIDKQIYKKHTDTFTCVSRKNAYLRCPLCHLDIKNFKEHILDKKCDSNPRNKSKRYIAELAPKVPVQQKQGKKIEDRKRSIKKFRSLAPTAPTHTSATLQKGKSQIQQSNALDFSGLNQTIDDQDINPIQIESARKEEGKTQGNTPRLSSNKSQILADQSKIDNVQKRRAAGTANASRVHRSESKKPPSTSIPVKSKIPSLRIGVNKRPPPPAGGASSNIPETQNVASTNAKSGIPMIKDRIAASTSAAPKSGSGLQPPTVRDQKPDVLPASTKSKDTPRKSIGGNQESGVGGSSDILKEEKKEK